MDNQLSNIFEQPCRNQNHQENKLEFFCIEEQCNNYNRLFCRLCLLENHLDHGKFVLDIRQIISNKNKDKINLCNWPSDKELKEILNQNSFTQELQAQIDEINKQYEILKDQVIEIISQMQKETIKKFSDQIQKLQKNQNAVQQKIKQFYDLEKLKDLLKQSQDKIQQFDYKKFKLQEEDLKNIKKDQKEILDQKTDFSDQILTQKNKIKNWLKKIIFLNGEKLGFEFSKLNKSYLNLKRIESNDNSFQQKFIFGQFDNTWSVIYSQSFKRNEIINLRLKLTNIKGINGLCGKHFGISAIHEKNEDLFGQNGSSGNNKCLGCSIDSVCRKKWKYDISTYPLYQILHEDIILLVSIHVEQNLFSIRDSQNTGSFISDSILENYDDWVFTIGSNQKDFTIEIM